MNYYERHLGDYAKQTVHLTMLEHGAYTLLLDRYYASEAGVPDAEKYRVSRATSKAERAAVDAVLCEFFRLVDGSWIKNRCQEEIERARERTEDGQERAENERERQRRHRAERKKLFTELRSYDIVPPFETKTEELRQLLGNAKRTDMSRVTGVTPTRDKTCTATAIQTPSTIYHLPSTNTQDSERAGGAEIDEAATKGDLVTLTEAEHHQAFERVRAAYPKFYGQQPGVKLEVACRNLVNQGATWDELEAGAKRYAAFIRATDQIVMSPLKFFTAENEPWRQEWAIPPDKADKRLNGNLSAAEEFMRRTDEPEPEIRHDAK